MGNQQPSPVQGKVQRLSERSRVTSDRLLEVVSTREGKDIVCAFWKQKGVETHSKE